MAGNCVKNCSWIILGTFLRYLVYLKYNSTLSNRIEVSTPLNSFKRVQEGIYLYKNDIDPYSGDMFHESPLILWALTWITENLPKMMPLLYFLLDVLTGFILQQMTSLCLQQQYSRQKKEEKTYPKDTKDLVLQEEDISCYSDYVLLAYLFNPFTVASSAALTSTVYSNLLLSLYLYFLVRRNIPLCLLFLSLETLRSMYPFVLIAPAILIFSKGIKIRAVGIVFIFAGLCLLLSCACSSVIGGYQFLDKTLGFIFFYRDLQPNVGLFWYFFTEMFDHFRTMFLITFQMNATVLYLIPLSIKLRKEPLILATILTGLMAVFRSYPCVGDVGFYVSLLPLWKKCWKFMAHNFVVFCFFLITIAVMPALWHLWIYSGSANANFYFGVTLAFSTGQIFLVTDLLFAYVKREFCLKNGQKFFIDGKEARIILDLFKQFNPKPFLSVKFDDSEDESVIKTRCLEELYWNCIEERFCYDESIAQYNPDDDECIGKSREFISPIPQSDNNNVPICTQPLSRTSTNLSSKIHEEDYKRAIQTSVPILAPEILSVFANSQIFHDHQPKLTKSLTKPYLPIVHGKDKETDQEKLIKQLEGDDTKDNEPKKKIKFTISPDSPASPELIQTASSLKDEKEKSATIPEEDEPTEGEEKENSIQKQQNDEVILRPSKIEENKIPTKPIILNKKLRNVHSVPYFSFRPASETDIYAISGSMSQISMTPEIPSISFSMLPKNYEDTPTIEKYKESISLYSIQAANQAKAKSIELDYTMPRYFRRTNVAQSVENFNAEKPEVPKRHEKSKRLKTLRDSLPPLRIHSMRNKSRED